MAFTATTPNSAGAWRPDVYTFAPTDVVDEALLLQIATMAGAIEGDAPSVRVAFVVDDTASITAEAAAIPEAQPQLSEVLIHTSKITQLVRLSREQFMQQETASQLALSVARAVTRRADRAIVSEPAPIGPAVAPVAGLLNTPGIVDGGHTVADLDPIIDLIAELEANLSVPTHIVTGPLGWAELRKLKIGTAFNSTLLGAGTEDAVPLLLGLPVIVTKAITDESGLVVDRRAIAAASSAILVNTSMDRYFEMDQVLLRATWRVGHAVVHPSRIGRFTVGPDGS